MTTRLKSDTQNTLPHGNASQVGGYPGIGGRMLSEWVGGCSGIRSQTPNTVWLADITYIDTDEGWLYLAGVKDMATREIVALSAILGKSPPGW